MLCCIIFVWLLELAKYKYTFSSTIFNFPTYITLELLLNYQIDRYIICCLKHSCCYLHLAVSAVKPVFMVTIRAPLHNRKNKELFFKKKKKSQQLLRQRGTKSSGLIPITGLAQVDSLLANLLMEVKASFCHMFFVGEVT